MSGSENRFFVRRYDALLARNENAILAALSAGPVVVGICGTDSTFLFYSSGVYNAAECCTEQNHAMLLVGFDHDNKTGLDYWLAQNRRATHHILFFASIIVL